MTTTIDLKQTWPREFVPAEFDAGNWDHIEPLWKQLQDRELDGPESIEAWMRDWSELEVVVREESSRRHINMTCHTNDEEIEKAHLHMVTQITPKMKPYRFALAKKLIAAPGVDQLDQDYYEVYLRSVRNRIELYREENIPLEAEDSKKFQAYQKLNGAMTVEWEGETKTLQQMAPFLMQQDRAIRQEVWEMTSERRLQDREAVDTLFEELIDLRGQRATNAGFANFRDYAHRSKDRFDYTPADCIEFHNTIEKLFVPLQRELQAKRQERLGVDTLRPWDLQVDPEGSDGLKPFKTVDELISGCYRIFEKVDPELAEQFAHIRDSGNLDLDSRIGKAPGGYQATYSEQRQPFIFMNSSGVHRNVMTLLHEGGHAFHTFACRNQPLLAYRHSPMEFAEVASMSMEMLGEAYLDEFYSEEEMTRARRETMEKSVWIFPWVATIDGFQQWIYTTRGHGREERKQTWLGIKDRFGGIEDWTGYGDARAWQWHQQLHLFGAPFYYVEYAIAELGALQVWRNAREDRESAVANYRKSLALGGSKPLPALFEAAGIRFDFSYDGVAPLVEAIRSELEELGSL